MHTKATRITQRNKFNTALVLASTCLRVQEPEVLMVARHHLHRRPRVKEVQACYSQLNRISLGNEKRQIGVATVSL